MRDVEYIHPLTGVSSLTDALIKIGTDAEQQALDAERNAAEKKLEAVEDKRRNKKILLEGRMLT